MPDTRLFALSGATRRHPDVARGLSSLPGDLQAIARCSMEEIRGAGPEVRELLHDVHPTACVGDLAFACVNAFREHVNIGFFLATSLVRCACEDMLARRLSR